MFRENEDYKQVVKAGALDEGAFVELTLEEPLPGAEPAYRRIVVRPVQLKKGLRLQFSRFTRTQDFTKNYLPEEAARELDEALAEPYGVIRLRSTRGDVRVRVRGDGRASVSRAEPAAGATPPALEHDRRKALPLPGDAPDPFLQGIGVQNSHGRVRPEMRAKLTQINEFLKLLEHTGGLRSRGDSPLSILDLGCGSAYLTFAAYHYLNHLKGVSAAVTGVDRNAALIAKCEELRGRLGRGYEGLEFVPTAIGEYVPPQPPDLVFSLHACDTATDDALALAVRWEARAILSVPCCHHYLNARLRSDALAPVLRHGILKQRTADIVTDAFRALLLRILGYRAEVIEFTDPEHTSRNLMLRAVRAVEPGAEDSLREYEELKRFWGVTPYLEGLVTEQLRAASERTAPAPS
jgi:SAM-dependent methyltransferase